MATGKGILRRAIDNQIENRQRFQFGVVDSYDPNTGLCTVTVHGGTIHGRRRLTDVIMPQWTAGMKPPDPSGKMVMVAYDTSSRVAPRIVSISPISVSELQAAEKPVNPSDSSGYSDPYFSPGGAP